MSNEFVTTDSGARQKFETGAQRDIQEGKGRYDLLPPIAIRRLAQLYERGSKKYSSRNWEKGIPLMRYIDSAMRHMNNLVAGEPLEDHCASTLWNIAGYMWTLNEIEAGRLPKALDDRPPPEPQYDPNLKNGNEAPVDREVDKSVYCEIDMDTAGADFKKENDCYVCGSGKVEEPQSTMCKNCSDYLILCNTKLQDTQSPDLRQLLNNISNSIHFYDPCISTTRINY